MHFQRYTEENDDGSIFPFGKHHNSFFTAVNNTDYLVLFSRLVFIQFSPMVWHLKK